MKDWGDKQELLRRIERARSEARNHAFPLQAGNDTLEAAMFVASMYALDQWADEQNQPATIMPAPPVEEAPALPPPEPVVEAPQTPQLPEVNYAT